MLEEIGEIIMVIVRIRRRLRTSGFFRVNMKRAFPTSEWPQRLNLTSDLKFSESSESIETSEYGNFQVKKCSL